MDIDAILIARDIEEKLSAKHGVSREEVEEVFESNPRIHYAERGHIHGEDLYRAVGRTENGRYLVVFFVYKQDQSALVISARPDSKRKETICKKVTESGIPFRKNLPMLRKRLASGIAMI